VMYGGSRGMLDCTTRDQLLDFAKVMPDRSVVYKFRNGKKEIVSLDA